MTTALVLIALLLMSTPAAHAIGCVVNGPRYGLTAEIVNWSMKIGTGQSCIRGLRYNNVIIESLELVSLPRTGQVTIEGPGFTYTAKSGYEGEDSFTIALSGTINRVKGSSTIRLTVSVGNSGIGDHPPRNLRGPIVPPNLPMTTPIDVDPTRFGLPTADTAGVPAGATLTNYNGPMTITTPGAVIENVIINGQLTVDAANVTVRNCVIQTNDWFGVHGEQSPNLTVQNCKIIGGDQTNSGILGNGTFSGNDISHTCIGIQLTDGASTVSGNYIHDLFYDSIQPHYDGITALGGQDHVVIEHNTISIPSGYGGTAEVFLDNDFGSVNDVIIRDNLLYGDPAYTIQLVQKANLPGTITNVVVENNYLEKGEYGYILQQNMAPAAIRNNIAWDNGKDPIPYPDDGPFALRNCGYGLRCPLVAR
ncbi:right-handed parallel beta-helix repeat-containing protein [Bradyrhizobium sp. C-145]|uniref:right-handed parallel beta-helix repeat-containing protein n=1 Tax=Bradyrhizobium sp. C-145 TaxID=574727 RepID=UPI00201B903F|nr:right-handed parallel beta-helix repeat-containing protein [Bradyrhizobium sp. C-145]UQR61042.1 right-handed parallel beta-helix repeat-containing protein [Bradyrhizobium sp. C-145]